MKEELKGKKFLITGGTGSFGHAVTDRLLKEGAGEIVIFSRDEKKQFDMAKEYGGRQQNPFCDRRCKGIPKHPKSNDRCRLCFSCGSSEAGPNL